MNKKEERNKKVKEVSKIEDANMTHGSRLLEREFRRQERARKIVEEMIKREKKNKK
ncbi:MAG: hypothetical protein ACXAD7_19400 [Candidatus Kariarchaeaceae archaeon]